MRYCPQCNRQYTEPWVTFCSDDGTLLIEQLAAPRDPNWDPRIREPGVKSPSEQETQWLPREPPMQGGWIAPDERPPMTPPAWSPPPAPLPVKQQSQGLAMGSMITGILGLVLGCLGPLPGIAAVVLGFMALSQIKQAPETNTGKSLAIVGIVTGILTIVFYSLLILLWFLSGVMGGVFGTL